MAIPYRRFFSGDTKPPNNFGGNDEIDDYLNMAASLKTELEHSAELAKADGFIGAERFESLSTKGKLLSKSEWKDEESVTEWRNMAKHRICQKTGREHDFLDYKITVVTPLRCYTMTMRDEAPADANQYLTYSERV